MHEFITVCKYDAMAGSVQECGPSTKLGFGHIGSHRKACCFADSAIGVNRPGSCAREGLSKYDKAHIAASHAATTQHPNATFRSLEGAPRSCVASSFGRLDAASVPDPPTSISTPSAAETTTARRCPMKKGALLRRF